MSTPGGDPLQRRVVHRESPLPIGSPSQKRRSPARGERSFLGSFGGTGDGREPITTVMYASRVS